MDALAATLKSIGQGHLLTFHAELNNEQKSQLLSDIRDVDWHNLTSAYQTQVSEQLEGSKLKPVLKLNSDLLQELPGECIEGTTKCDEKILRHYQETGVVNIRQGKVAALVLAGGQGTRLGVSYPKGLYDVGLPSHKSLFQLQAERIIEMSQQTGGPIYWYVMTSGATMVETRQFFEMKNYFGLKASEVIFFEQGTLPCFGFDGKVLLDQKYKLSRSPNGNGGLYEALHKKGIIEHMKANGVEYVHVYCVDNILVRVCDPTFMGYCIKKQVDTGAKVIEKMLPTESVGTICKVGNRFRVIEYSEIPDDIAGRRNESTGKLAFNAGNICEHFFTVDFLESIKGDRELRYHLAIKKIPYVSLANGERIKPSEPNGIKLEKFIFDVFEFTQKFAAWEVKRDDEFSPLKNADGTEKDNPTTARQALLRAYEKNIFKV